MSGQLICLEGIDGSGKTTLSHLLSQEYLKRQQQAVFVDKKDLSFEGDLFAVEVMNNLKKCVWDYPPNLNLDLLGDNYWMHAISAWYSALYNLRIKPLLDTGVDVVVDGWVYKYICRFSLKSVVGAYNAELAFANVPRPDKVVLFDIPPEVAASRKESFKASESGKYDGEEGSRYDGFIRYQSKVSAVLREISVRENWVSISSQYEKKEDCAKALFKIVSEPTRN